MDELWVSLPHPVVVPGYVMKVDEGVPVAGADLLDQVIDVQ